jgi:hypothetical protein
MGESMTPQTRTGTGGVAPILLSAKADQITSVNRLMPNLSRHGAVVYCQWAGIRLSTQAEWEYTACEESTDPFLLATTLLVGTGGAATSPSMAAMAQAAARTALADRLEYAGARRRQENELVDLTEKLAYVQDQFSLNLSDTAAVLRVSRPTVYAWLRDDSEPQEHNIHRIDRLYALAKEWRETSPAPLGDCNRRIVHSGRSILELLSEADLNDSTIRAAFSTARRAMDRTGEGRRGRRSRSAEVADRFGLPEPTPDEQERAISEVTGT